MIHPTRDEFRAVARPGALVPVYREIVGDLETPVSAYMKLAQDSDYAFLLESVDQAGNIGRYSFLGAEPSVIFKSKNNDVTVVRNGVEEHTTSERPLYELRALMAEYHAVPVEGLPRFHGGAVGYVAYDEVRYFEKLPDKNPDRLGVPDLYFMITDTILIFDHVNHRLKVVSNAHVGHDVDAAYDDAVAKVDRLVEGLARRLEPAAPPPNHDAANHEFESNFTKAGYCKAVERAKEYIRAGDAFQIVLSQRFERDTTASPLTLYRALRCINPSPYMTLIRFPELTLVGSSPEVMTQVRDGKCIVRPIAGTRHRGATPKEDNALADELINDEKERAEHIMLVDLGRNDIGRVSVKGSVAPTTLMCVERYSHVMHITSEVEGALDEGQDAFTALEATFPMGTVSGAPKIRAMEIVDELENLRRGPYSGGAGYISFSGEMDTCIAIRTMVVKDNRVYVQAGGGIVYDSDPEFEYQETVNKAMALFRAVELAERGLEL